MNIGDLVELSAYGKRLKCMARCVGCLGLVVKVDQPYSPAAELLVDWNGGHGEEYHTRRDLKIAK